MENQSQRERLRACGCGRCKAILKSEFIDVLSASYELDLQLYPQGEDADNIKAMVSSDPSITIENIQRMFPDA